MKEKRKTVRLQSTHINRHKGILNIILTTILIQAFALDDTFNKWKKKRGGKISDFTESIFSNNVGVSYFE